MAVLVQLAQITCSPPLSNLNEPFLSGPVLAGVALSLLYPATLPLQHLIHEENAVDKQCYKCSR